MSFWPLKHCLHISIIFFLLSLSAPLMGQSTLEEIQEFENSIDTLQGEERYRAYLRLAQSYAQVDLDQCVVYLEKSIDLAKDLGRRDLEARSLNGMGISRYISGDLEGALEYYQKSLNINAASNDSSGLALNYSNLSNIYLELGDYNQAIDFYYKGLNLARKQGDSLTMGDIYNNLANLYNSLNENKKSIQYLRNSMAIFRAIDKEDVLTTYNNLGIAYDKANKPDSALYFYKACIEASYKFNQKPSRYLAIANIVTTYRDIDDLDSARYFMNIALNDPNLKDYDRSILKVGITELRLLYDEGDYQTGVEKSRSLMALAKKSGRMKEVVDISMIVQNFYRGLGNTDSAYYYLVTYVETKDSLRTDANIEELAKMEERYKYQVETERIENNYKLELAKEALARKWAYGVGAVLLALVFALLHNLRIRRKRNLVLRTKNAQIEAQKLEIELQGSELIEQKHRLESLNAFKDRIMAVMAHDLKSPLNSLQGLLDYSQVEEESDPKMIKSLLGKLSTQLVILRQSVENLLHWARLQIGATGSFDTTNTISIGQAFNEVHSLFNNLMKDKGISIEENLEEAQTIINSDPEVLRIVLRNLMSNALKFSPQSGTVYLKGHREEGYYYMEVQDEGPGIDPKKMEALFKDIVDPSVGTAAEKGTGLGLHLSGEFLRSSGGSIGVKHNEAKGAIFWVQLPIS